MACLNNIKMVFFSIHKRSDPRNKDIIQSGTKKRELLKNPTKIEEIQENKILKEIKSLQLAF